MTTKEQELYLAVKKMMVFLGMNGSIDTCHPTVEAVMNALYDIDGGTPKDAIIYGCHVCIDSGFGLQIYRDCVIDSGDYADCVHARPGMKKEQCKYWRLIATETKT